MTASPARLVVMLYDGAIRYLRQASAALRAGRHGVARERVRRARAVIDELNRSLDTREGGDVAVRLRSIYLFCTTHLNDATAELDADGYDRVAHLLAELRDAWQELDAAQLAESA